jgi:hypothetical protein
MRNVMRFIAARRICVIILFFITLRYANPSATSMVYNFRIAQITKQPVFEKTNNQNSTVLALLFDQYIKKYDGIKQNYAGGLASYIYDFKPYYFRADCAVSDIHERKNHTTTFSGMDTDDILSTLGRNFILNNRASLTLSGLFGVPTHKVHRLQHTDFGYGQVGTGLQLDGLYGFNHTSDIVYGARYVYFFSRRSSDNLGQKYSFSMGNVADLLVASKNKWNKHGLELGYTARFNFGARVSPAFDEIVAKTNYTRSNFYLVYKYKFLIKDIPNRFLFNISYGFDHSSKTFGNKDIITLWAAWDVNF